MHYLGPYHLIRPLARGGMATVYLAENEYLGRKVAIKIPVCPPALAEARLLREARAANRVSQEGIVAIYDLCHDTLPKGVYGSYLVMEYVDGIPLSKTLQSGPLPLLSALSIAKQIATSLAIAHGKGVIHRDIKPSNIMLVHDPFCDGQLRTKIIDFGVARLLEEEEEPNPHTDAEPLTEAGVLLGTPSYMAPEQRVDAHSVDGKADVFSLGRLLGKLKIQHTPKEALLFQKFQLLRCRMESPKREDRPTMEEVEVEMAALLVEDRGQVIPTRTAKAPFSPDPMAKTVLGPLVGAAVGVLVSLSWMAGRVQGAPCRQDDQVTQPPESVSHRSSGRSESATVGSARVQATCNYEPADHHVHVETP